MPHIKLIPASTSRSDANGNSKITTSGVGAILHGLIISVTNAAAANVELSDSTDPANSYSQIVPAAITANGTFSLDFRISQSRQSDWRVGTGAGVQVTAIVD